MDCRAGKQLPRPELIFRPGLPTIVGIFAEMKKPLKTNKKNF